MASYDVFTPTPVSEKMKSYFSKRITHLLEPSVGTGNLLRAVEGLYDTADIYDINADYLNQIPETNKIVKHHQDFLDAPVTILYDAIIMNPPYLKYQDMGISQRAKVRQISNVLESGNIDLYVAFLVKCVAHLTESGMLVAVVPSTWRYNKSTSAFRKWLLENRLIQEIYDYGSEKVFDGIDVYCCILVLTKSPKTHYVVDGASTPYDAGSTSTSQKTFRDTVSITNGIATLCDSVYIHDLPLFDEPCWKPILKVSKQKVRSIIFPYKNDGTLIPEDEFRKDNPRTYEFLQRNMERLGGRDRGNKTYEAWYAFGRRQGLKLPNVETSVYVSSLSQSTVPTFTRATSLFYSGLRLTSDCISTDTIQKSINVHAKNIASSCSKRANGWINVTTSVLREVPVLQPTS